MDDYDPLSQTRTKEFPKELQNMGIDKGAITGKSDEAGKSEIKQDEIKAEEPKQVVSDDYKEILARLGSTEKQISNLNDRIGGIVENMNSVLTKFNNRIEMLGKVPSKEKQEEQKSLADNPSDDLKPGDIQIEDYFNFSNAKFN